MKLESDIHHRILIDLNELLYYSIRPIRIREESDEEYTGSATWRETETTSLE